MIFQQNRPLNPRKRHKAMGWRALIPSKARRSHNQSGLIELIDPGTAGKRLSIRSTTLEYLADACMITHYCIDGEIRFDPNDLNAWVHRHKIDEVDKAILECLTSCGDVEEQL